MKVLVTGRGQLAQELLASKPENAEIVCLDRDELDITDADAVSRVVAEVKPDVIINAAAYTAVDKAESDVDTAWAVNKDGILNLATVAQSEGLYLLHISTDFVFDGSANRPYMPDAKPSPLGVYGESKLAGEQALQSTMAGNWAILRTAWVFSAFGANFVKTMLRLMTEKPSLGVIVDQIGSPTWANHLAKTCWVAVEEKLQGVHHCSCDGVASWYDFAVAIRDIGIEKGLLTKQIPIAPIPTEAYPTPAKRPHYSVLNNQSLRDALPNAPRIYWRDALTQVLGQLKKLETEER